MKKIIICISFLVAILLSGCNKEPKNMVLNVRNEVLYQYDTETTMEKDSFSKIDSIEDLFKQCGSNIIHKNNDFYYTVYNLKDNKLCYVFFDYDEETGKDMRKLEFLEYPNEKNEKLIKERVLSSDLPENIIK